MLSCSARIRQPPRLQQGIKLRLHARPAGQPVSPLGLLAARTCLYACAHIGPAGYETVRCASWGCITLQPPPRAGPAALRDGRRGRRRSSSQCGSQPPASRSRLSSECSRPAPRSPGLGRFRVFCLTLNRPADRPSARPAARLPAARPPSAATGRRRPRSPRSFSRAGRARSGRVGPGS